MDRLTGGFYLKEVKRWFRSPILVAMVEVEEPATDQISLAMGAFSNKYYYREATAEDISKLKSEGAL